MIVILFFLLIIFSCAPKPAQKLEGINYIDVAIVDGDLSLSYYKENPLKAEKPKEPPKRVPKCSRGSSLVALWVWRPHLVEDPRFKVLVNELGITRIYLQVRKDMDPKTLKYLKSLGLEVYLLDGARDVKINFPISFINGLPADGFQVDIEPYLRKDFNLKREKILRDYVKLLKRIKQNLKGKKFSVVIPFWFDKFYLKDKPLLEYIFRIADEVVVMAYRRDLREAIKLSFEEISMGRRFRKPVLIGLELFPLKDERHFVYKVERRGLRLVGKYTVKGKDLVFPKEKAGDLKSVRCEGVEGFVLHSLGALL